MESQGWCACRCLKIPGMHFEPSDQELLEYHLKGKVEGGLVGCSHLFTELQIYRDDCLPWEIIRDDNPAWVTSSRNKNNIKKTIFVFTELSKKKTRVIRRSGGGSWTGQNSVVVKNKAGNTIGYNKLLTFYKDEDDKKGKKNKKVNDDQEEGHWNMHEYSLFGIDNYVLCKIIKEVMISAKDLVLCPVTYKAAVTHDFRTQGDAQITNVISNEEKQGGDDTTDWDKNGWMEELYEQLGSGDEDLTVHSHEENNMICNNQISDFLEDEEAVAVVNQPSDYLGAELEGNGQIFDDDFWNDYLSSNLNSTWDESDVTLDFSSPDLADLWPNESNEQTGSIITGQPGKRMRYGAEEYEEHSSGKKQRCV